MNKIKIFLILIVLFISISAVSAEGNFTALQNEIDSSGDSIEITQDYTYDNVADKGFEKGILINKSDFTINGNGHTLDGANQARIFNINPGNRVTILNLNFINGNSDDGAAILTEQSLTINNASFINNNATNNGIICSKFHELTINNCYFDNNTAKFGGVYIYESTTPIEIINSTFTNSKSKYAPAIYLEKIREFTIQDCIFENLFAEESAGAIGARNIRIINITNCTFTNTTSCKNGGAVYLDPLYNAERAYPPKIEINKCKFFNATGDYGGALTILSAGIGHTRQADSPLYLFFGDLDMNDCEFYDNTALYSGGAVYISGINGTIKNTKFYKNKISYDLDKESTGGGIYIDFSNVTIENCEFMNNTKQGIYAYENNYTTYVSTYENKTIYKIMEFDNKLNVKNTTFSNNGEAIHAVFTDCNLINITVGNDTLCLNDTNYISNVHEIAKSISLINNTINVETLPSRYDSRDWGWVSSVKNQGNMGACWTFGTCGALESALLKATGIEYDLSENNMQDNMLQFSKYGIIGQTEGGKDGMGLEYILSWFGIMSSEYDPYDEVGKLSPLIITDDEKIHIFDAIIVEPRKNSTDNDELKKAILRCGSVVTSYCSDDYTFEGAYNKANAAWYQNRMNYTSHCISIVGWDDNFPASKFSITPPGDGAFIIKNSWGTDSGDNGFIYISYYDPSVLNTSIAIGFIIENTENYTTNYQTDFTGLQETITNNGSILSYKNTYESEYGPELISAVGTYFEENENYTLEIYVNDKLAHTQCGISPFSGYHTVKLTREIPITKKDKFTALMKKKSVKSFTQSKVKYIENMTFIDLGDGWKDIAKENKTISLKVYTKDLAIYTQDLVKIYKNESQFVADIGVANETVTFEINGKNYTKISDENGTALMAINLGPGNYTIKTSYNNTTVENTITVLPTLIAENLVKYYRNESQFYIDLIDGEGNPVTGTNITMNINGVFYNRTTNENGTARLNINLIPGEYILTAIDPLTGLQMSYNITVLPTLTADDMKMSYKDGSTFNATVLDGQGNPLAKATVTFNINGVLYNRTTDSNGTAKLNINLMAGEYIITSQYGQATISNKITISS